MHLTCFSNFSLSIDGLGDSLFEQLSIFLDEFSINTVYQKLMQPIRPLLKKVSQRLE